MKKHLLTILALSGLVTSSFAQIPSYVPTNGMIGWWPFDGNANDESSNNLDGSVVGAQLTSDRFNATNAAYDFDHEGASFGQQLDEVYIPFNSVLNVQNISVSVWIHPRSYYWSGNPNDAISCILRRYQYTYSTPTGGVWSLDFGMGYLRASIQDVDNNIAAVTFAESLMLNEWSHVVFTYDGAQLLLYLNGNLVASQSTGLVLNVSGNSGISVGESNQANGYWYHTDGKIDDIGIWNRALSSEEVSALNEGEIATCVAEIAVEGNTEICAGQSITLDAEVDGTGPSGTALYSVTKPVTSLWSEDWPINPNSSYVLEVSGTYSMFGNCVDAFDAAYTYSTGCSLNDCEAYNGSAAAGRWYINGLLGIRPTNDVCGGDNGVYYYNISGLSNLEFSFYDDMPSDNSGALTFELYEVGGASSTTYLWSTEETTPSIEVSPSETTTYTVTVFQNGLTCTDEVTITVHAQPSTVITTSGSTSFCENASVVLSSSEGDTYLWSNGEITQSIIVDEADTYSVTVTNGTNCSATSDPVTVTVFPNPFVSLAPLASICDNASSVVLSGGNPSGGTYTVNGNPASHLDPSSTGSGQHTVAYTYIDGNGCSNTATRSVMVNAAPSVSLSGLNTAYLPTDSPVQLSGSPAGGVFNGTGVSNGQFDPAAAGLGTHSVQYIFVGANGCIGSAGLCTTLDISTGGGIGLDNGGSSIQAFPNPSSGLFTLIMDGIEGVVQLSVLDIRGREIISQSVNAAGRTTHYIDLSGYATGIYTLRTQSVLGSGTLKLVRE